MFKITSYLHMDTTEKKTVKKQGAEVEQDKDAYQHPSGDKTGTYKHPAKENTGQYKHPSEATDIEE